MLQDLVLVLLKNGNMAVEKHYCGSGFQSRENKFTGNVVFCTGI